MTERYDTLFDSGASVESVAQASIRFFESHGLPAMATLIGSASGGGLPGAAAPFRIALPGALALRENGPAILSAVAHSRLDGIDDAEQYTTAYAPADDQFGSIVDVDRPDGPYLLALDPERFENDLRGLTAPALRKRLTADGTRSLTAMEYLIVQRIMTAFYSDHRFDYYGTEAENTRWMWIPDSALGDKTFMGYWNPGKNRVELSMCRTGSKNPRKGAYITTVHEL